MNTPKDQHVILACENAKLPDSIRQGPSGVYPMSRADALTTLDRAGTWFGPRGILETDTRFRQIIPYVVIRCQGKYLTYTRPAGVAEERLASKSSFGFGGHVDVTDYVGSMGDEDATTYTIDPEPKLNLGKVLGYAASREVHEEIGEHVIADMTTVGLILDKSPGVGDVHIGLLDVWDVEDTGFSANPNEAVQVSYKTLDELLEVRDTLELWSAFALDYLRALEPPTVQEDPAPRSRRRKSETEAGNPEETTPEPAVAE